MSSYYQQLGESADGARFGYPGESDLGSTLTFNTYSGTDMRVFFGPREVGTLDAITIGVVREKSPIYTNLGTNPRGFARGKRSISGSMSFAQFDKHALLYGPFYQYLNQGKILSTMDNRTDQLGLPGYQGVTTDMFGRERSIQYGDQLPPFDAVITFCSEQGAASVLKVVGIEIVTEGYGFTVDDISQNMAVSYVAREVIPLAPVADVNKYFRRSNHLSHERPHTSI